MKILQFLTGLCLIGGVAMIAFAKQLAVLKEGSQYSMSDLGFVVYGMMLLALGAIFLVTLLVVWLMRKKRRAA